MDEWNKNAEKEKIIFNNRKRNGQMEQMGQMDKLLLAKKQEMMVDQWMVN